MGFSQSPLVGLPSFKVGGRAGQSLSVPPPRAASDGSASQWERGGACAAAAAALGLARLRWRSAAAARVEVARGTRRRRRRSATTTRSGSAALRGSALLPPPPGPAAVGRSGEVASRALPPSPPSPPPPPGLAGAWGDAASGPASGHRLNSATQLEFLLIDFFRVGRDLGRSSPTPCPGREKALGRDSPGQVLVCPLLKDPQGRGEHRRPSDNVPCVLDELKSDAV